MNSVSEHDVVTLAMQIAGAFEGCSLKEYICPAGKPTIGHGRVIKHGQYPNGISQAQADQFFYEDVTRFAKAVIEAASGSGASVNELAALTSFAYNCGTDALFHSALWRAFKADEKATASRQFLRWCHAGPKVLAGLFRRRLCEQFVFNGGTIADLQKSQWLAHKVKV